MSATLALLAVLGCGAAEADVRIQLVPRAELIGDGRVVPIELRVDTDKKVKSRISVKASKGKVVAGPVINGVALLAYTAPKLKKAKTITFKIAIRVGGKRVREKLRLKVLPKSAATPKASGVELAFDAAAPIKVQLRPASLILERDRGKAEVFVDLGGEGEIDDVQLFTNAGSVSTPQPTDNPRRYRATYQPADVFFPHVGILVAVGKVGGEERVAWGAMRLWGAGKVTVKAIPGSLVRLTLAGKVFGPKRADGLGRAKVPVEVPPGYDTATYRKKKVPVKVVPFLRTFTWLERPTISGDGSESTGVRIFAVTRRGEPLQDSNELRVEVEGGRATPPQLLEPGVFRVEVTAEPGGAPPTVSSGTLDGDARSTASFRTVGGAPASLEVELPDASLVAGGASTQLRVRVLDASGNASDTDALQVTGASLEIGAVREVDVGTFEITVAAPRELPPDRSASLEVSVGALKRRAPVTLVPAAAQKITLSQPPALIASGDTAAVRAKIVDAFGNPILLEQITATAQQGVVTSIEEDEEGVILRYRTPLAYEAVTDTISVSAGGAKRAFELPLSARARGFTVGIHGGWMTNLGSLQAPAGGLDVGWRFANADLALLRGLGFVADVSIWHDQSRADSSAGLVQSTLTAVPVGLGLRYEIPFLSDGRVSLSALGVGGLLNSSVTFPGDKGGVSERILTAGGTGILGAGWRVGPGDILVQVRGTALLVGAQETGDGLFWGLGLRAGYRVPLF